MVKSVGYIILLLLLLGDVFNAVGGSQKQIFEGVAQASQSNPGLLSRSEALELSGAINDMSKSERVIYLADVAENNIERVCQVENVLTKFVKDAKSVAHTSDFTEFFEALENVRSLKRFSHMFTHIEELRDLWPDVSRLNMFVDDLVRNESLLDLFKGAPDNATRLRYSKAWNHLDLAESGSKVDPTVITKLADDILNNPALETFLEGGVGRVKAWETVENMGSNPSWRKYTPLLEELNDIIVNPTLLNKIGGETTLTEILTKNSASPFGGCNCGQQWFPNIEETIEALNQFANKFNQAKVNSIVSGLSNPVNSFRRGAVQELRGVRNQINEIVDVQVSLPNTSRIADAQLTNGRWKEIKSTSNILQKVGTDDFPQFKAYIQNVSDIGDLKYSFDKEFLKAPTTAGGLGLADDIEAINHAREQIRLVFKNNAEEIFETNPDIFTLFDKLNGQGNIENFEDLFDLANSQSFVNHPIIQNLVEIQ